MAKRVNIIVLFSLGAAIAAAQSMTEFGAAAAGSAVGAGGGKAVSTGIDAIFGKLNDQTVKAAGKEETKPKPEVKPPDKAPVASAPLISTSGGGSNGGSLPGGGSSRGGGAVKWCCAAKRHHGKSN